MAESSSSVDYSASDTSVTVSSISPPSDTSQAPSKRQKTLDRDWKAVDGQRSFKEEWRKKYFVIPHPANGNQCLCLVCRAVFTQLKSHTIKRHFDKKHQSFVSMDPRAKGNKYDRLLAAYQSERMRIQKPNDITFRLYLEFLFDTLPLLDDINRKLQTPNVDMYKIYCTIESFRRAFASPVLKDVSKSASDLENHVESSEVIFHGPNFNKFISECATDSDLTEDAIERIRSNCVKFMITTAQELEERFPESKFVVDNFSFLNPQNRVLRTVDIDVLATRFSSPTAEVSREYSRYIHDQNVDDCFHHCDGNLVKLWTLLKDEGYPGLSNIAFGIMAMSPENASCERAFSVMKYIKNDQRTCLTQLHLDNALRIAMDTRTPSEFPYDSIK